MTAIGDCSENNEFLSPWNRSGIIHSHLKTHLMSSLGRHLNFGRTVLRLNSAGGSAYQKCLGEKTANMPAEPRGSPDLL